MFLCLRLSRVPNYLTIFDQERLPRADAIANQCHSKGFDNVSLEVSQQWIAEGILLFERLLILRFVHAHPDNLHATLVEFFDLVLQTAGLGRSSPGICLGVKEYQGRPFAQEILEFHFFVL